MGGRGSNSKFPARRELSGSVSFEQIVHASKNSIAFSKIVTVIPSGYVPQTGKKGDLETLINSYGIKEVTVNMYRDKAGANDLKRMQKLGFEIVAYYKAPDNPDSAIPPKDYYYMRKKT